jgi:hypothetical protein
MPLVRLPKVRKTHDGPFGRTQDMIFQYSPEWNRYRWSSWVKQHHLVRGLQWRGNPLDKHESVEISIGA